MPFSRPALLHDVVAQHASEVECSPFTKQRSGPYNQVVPEPVPSFRQVFFRLEKVSRHIELRSLRGNPPVKSVDDYERRRRDEKSHSVEQQKKTFDGPKLVREVMEKLELRRPAEREYIAEKILHANTTLERLGQNDPSAREKEDVNLAYADRGLPAPHPEHDAHLQSQKEAYQQSFEAGRKGLEIPTDAKENPKLIEAYIKGLDDHKTDLHIRRDIERADVPQSNFVRANLLMTSAQAAYDKLSQPSLERHSLEVKSEGPELGH